ncbi:FecR family protein [Albibacterium indicum]|uniref:FecR family protein n=1 Tax=Albibacterium indicum TaxID=2292082 RepID=UPI000E475D06|nr:FecR family protein [Pedobacter indicus]
MSEQTKIKELLERFVNNKLTLKELKELLSLTDGLEHDELNVLIKDTLDNSESNGIDDFYVEERVLHLQQKIQSIIQTENPEEQSKSPFYKKSWFYIAATLAAFFMFCYWFVHEQRDMPLAAESFAYDAMPGTDKAIISVDGEEYELSSEKKNVVFSKDSLFYGDGTPILATRESKTLKIVTPYGGQYQLTLGDGTKVWLNAGSELTYKSNFGRDERSVSVKGEVYFDVVENKNMPFYVINDDQRIKVLGTAFNVKAYPGDNQVTTTLERGALEIKSNSQTHLLKPNQQLIVDTETKTSEMLHVDAKDVLSWKEGVFNLQGLSLEECMKVISRWYNIDVYYDGPIPEITLGGKMGRGVRLSTFLHFLQDNFEISAEMPSEGKLIIKSI